MHQFFPPPKGQPTASQHGVTNCCFCLQGAGVEQCFGCKYANLHLFPGKQAWWHCDSIGSVPGIGGFRMLSPFWSCEVWTDSCLKSNKYRHQMCITCSWLIFVKPNVEPENNKCTTHLSVFWYEHLLKHGWGLSRRGCVSCSFFFQTDIDWCFGVQLEIQNIPPVVTRFLCPKLCKILGRAKGFCQPHPYVIPYCITLGLNEFVHISHLRVTGNLWMCEFFDDGIIILDPYPWKTWRCLSWSNTELSCKNFSLGHHQALGCFIWKWIESKGSTKTI